MKNDKSYIGRLLLIIVTLSFASAIFAQNDSIELDYQKSFNDFNKQIEDDFSGFKSKNDSLFYEFLSQSWKEYTLILDQPEMRPKPKKQPILNTNASSGIRIIYDTIIDKATTETYDIYEDNPDKYMKMNRVDKDKRSFYGIQLPLINLDKEPIEISNKIEQDVAAFYKDISTQKEIDLMFNELMQVKEEYCLNDWAFLELLSHTAKLNYKSHNEQMLFIWYVLIDADYLVKIGYVNTDLCLLLSFSSPIFYTPYLIIDQQKYYVFYHSNQDLASINTYAIKHPNQKKVLSLLSDGLPKFPDKPFQKEFKYNDKVLQLTYNESITDFYKTFPATELAVYLKSPLSDVAKKRFSEYLSPVIKDMSDKEKIDFLLYFIQYSFPYKNDEEQFATEKYMFAEETISYPYTDCEDRVVLLDKLVKEFTALNTIVLLYPDHVVLGVVFDTINNGAYIQYQRKNYYIADPTFLGAKFGEIMEDYQSVSPQVLVY